MAPTPVSAVVDAAVGAITDHLPANGATLAIRLLFSCLVILFFNRQPINSVHKRLHFAAGTLIAYIRMEISHLLN